MGRPDNLEEFVRLDADDVTVFVRRELLDRHGRETRRLRFYIDGYGSFWLKLPERWRGVR